MFNSYVKLPEGTQKSTSINVSGAIIEFYLFVEMKTNMISPPKIRRFSV